MNIWIMRHGEAGFNASSDAARCLNRQWYKKHHFTGKMVRRTFSQPTNSIR